MLDRVGTHAQTVASIRAYMFARVVARARAHGAVAVVQVADTLKDVRANYDYAVLESRVADAVFAARSEAQSEA